MKLAAGGCGIVGRDVVGLGAGVGAAGVARGQGYGVRSDRRIAMARALGGRDSPGRRSSRTRPVGPPVVPSVNCTATGAVAGGGGPGEASHRRLRIDGDVVRSWCRCWGRRRCSRSRYGVGSDRRVAMARALGGRIPLVAEAPRPGRRAAGRAVCELHGHRHIAGGGGPGETGHRRLRIDGDVACSWCRCCGRRRWSRSKIRCTFRPSHSYGSDSGRSNSPGRRSSTTRPSGCRSCHP